MNGEVISVVADADLGKLSPRLLASGLRMMPITDHRGRLVGIVTRSDLMLWDHPPVARIDRVDRLMRRARRLVGAGAVRVDRDAQVRGGVTPNLAAHRLSPDLVRVRDQLARGSGSREVGPQDEVGELVDEGGGRPSAEEAAVQDGARDHVQQ
jgi:hypothetical protein